MPTRPNSPDHMPTDRSSTQSQRHAAVRAVLPQLRCPTCTVFPAALQLETDRVVCAKGHSFDVARHGYVNFAVGNAGPKTGDTGSMVAARDRFLTSERYRPIADEVAKRTASAPAGLVIDLAGGTGYYLARVLDALPDHAGICIDLSAAALRRAAGVHPRATAVGADAWSDLPVDDGAAAVVLSIFGPRNPDEIQRVLRPGGLLVIVTPTKDHLRELIAPVGMLTVGTDKTTKLATDYAGMTFRDSRDVSFLMTLSHAAILDLVSMGPTAHHIAQDALARTVGLLPDPQDVTASVQVTIYAKTES